MTKRTWKLVDWAECEACGSCDVDAYTTADKWECYDGDLLRCDECGTTSHVNADEDGGPWAGEWTGPDETVKP